MFDKLATVNGVTYEVSVKRFRAGGQGGSARLPRASERVRSPAAVVSFQSTRRSCKPSTRVRLQRPGALEGGAPVGRQVGGLAFDRDRGSDPSPAKIERSGDGEYAKAA